MADFQQAIKKILDHEGGYIDDSSDAGGETYRGISRKNWPNWRGWIIIDKAKPLKRGQVLKDKHLDQLVEVFYYDRFWKPVQGDKITDQQVATFIFDWQVNSGYHAVIAAQQALDIEDDGVMGPQTLSAINSADPVQLFADLKERRLKFYKDIVTRRPGQAKFLPGWTNRVNSF